jgi:hypothetical protein
MDPWGPTSSRTARTTVARPRSCRDDAPKRVRMLRQPRYPSHRPSDAFSNDDYQAGGPARLLRLPYSEGTFPSPGPASGVH